MGCDFFIYKILDITDTDGKTIAWIELSCDKGYFPDSLWSSNSFDSDDSHYDEQLQLRKEKFLETTYKPIILFDNCQWKNQETKLKYESIIQSYMTNSQFLLISSIIKLEYRCERE